MPICTDGEICKDTPTAPSQPRPRTPPGRSCTPPSPHSPSPSPRTGIAPSASQALEGGSTVPPLRPGSAYSLSRHRKCYGLRCSRLYATLAGTQSWGGYEMAALCDRPGTRLPRRSAGSAGGDAGWRPRRQRGRAGICIVYASQVGTVMMMRQYSTREVYPQGSGSELKRIEALTKAVQARSTFL